MKIALLGATGKVGKLVIEQALVKGYYVKALARNPQKLTPIDKLEVIQGDALNATDLERLIAGCDLVISTIGNSLTKFQKNLEVDYTTKLISAMGKQGIKRLIVLSGAYGGKYQDDLNPLFKLMHAIFLKKIFADKVTQSELIENSSLDWTIVRGLLLLPIDIGQKLKIHKLGDKIGLLKIPFCSRFDAAKFLLECAEQNNFIKQQPVIYY